MVTPGATMTQQMPQGINTLHHLTLRTTVAPHDKFIPHNTPILHYITQCYTTWHPFSRRVQQGLTGRLKIYSRGSFIWILPEGVSWSEYWLLTLNAFLSPYFREIFPLKYSSCPDKLSWDNGLILHLTLNSWFIHMAHTHIVKWRGKLFVLTTYKLTWGLSNS